MKDKAYENYYRRKAKRLDLQLIKSRSRLWSIHDQGGWMIVDPYNGNAVVKGADFDLTIEEAVKFLEEYEIKLKSS